MTSIVQGVTKKVPISGGLSQVVGVRVVLNHEQARALLALSNIMGCFSMNDWRELSAIVGPTPDLVVKTPGKGAFKHVASAAECKYQEGG